MTLLLDCLPLRQCSDDCLMPEPQLALAVEAISVDATSDAAAPHGLAPLLVSPSPVAGYYGHIARSYVGLAEVSGERGKAPGQQGQQPLRPEGPPFLDMRMQMSPQKLVQVHMSLQDKPSGHRSVPKGCSQCI